MSIRPRRAGREAGPRPEARAAARAAGFSAPGPGVGDARLTEAIRGLLVRFPELSARGPAPSWLLPALLLLAFVVGFGAVLEPFATLGTAGLVLVAPFLGVTALRMAGAIEVLRHPSRRPLAAPRAPVMSARLPSYAVLVPLYDEPEVLPGLVSGLAAIDYPTDRLDIVLVLEARDRATRAAAERMALPAHMRIVLVPTGGPRTKPKALNYALAFVASEMVVVFDAEDRPERDQLRRVAAAFEGAGRDLACVQARLNVYNPAASFFTRQFALEYSALFDGFLPALERLGLPIPLGGTSNHLRLSVLREIGAWDPYNVTEDADLGIRLARMGYRTATVDSTTWEEAPTTFRIWLGQRTRWLKGWIQTFLVHMRQPGRLLDDLGPWQCLGVMLVMGGVLLSVLVYPLAAAALAAAWAMGFVRHWEAGSLGLVASLTLGAGILAPMLAAALAALRRRRAWLIAALPLMPIYWLLISVAGYRAMIELARRPFHWEKTRHGLASSRNGRRLPPPRKPQRRAGASR